MMAIKCVCGSHASPESIATFPMDMSEADARAIKASLHEALLRTTAQ